MLILTLLPKYVFFIDVLILLASYCASKGAVSSLTRHVAVEYAKHRIHCNSISPGCKYFLAVTWRYDMLRCSGTD